MTRGTGKTATSDIFIDDPTLNYKFAPDLPVRTHGVCGKAIDWSVGWPEKTDLLCWYCCHPFDTKPFPCPLKYLEKRDAFEVMGCFCSMGCIKAYVRNDRALDSMTVALFAKRLRNKVEPIVSAPPRIMLRAFGGHLSIDDFRSKSGLGIKYDVLPQNMIVRKQLIMEQRHQDRQVKAVDLDVAVDLGRKGVASGGSASTGETAVSNTIRLRRPRTAVKQTLFDKIVAASKT